MRKGTRCTLAPLLAVCAGLCVAVVTPPATGAEGTPGAGSVPAALELYALEAELAAARDRVAVLAAERGRVAAERVAARRQLRVAKRALATAQLRLARLVRGIYAAGEPEPLAVLLGAQSLDDAQAGLDALRRAAVQSRAVGNRARAAGAVVGRLERALAARERSLAGLEADARRRSDALAAVVGRRRVYLTELTRRESAAGTTALRRQVAAAQRRSDELTAAAHSTATGPAALATTVEPSVAVRGVRQLTVDALAYSLPGRTASGLPVGRGVVAVDPTVIALGTWMDVPGYGPAIAADVGAAVKGLVIDLWFPTLAEARAWGRRTVTITLS